MQKQKSRIIAKALLVGSLMMPLVSSASEFSSSKNIVRDMSLASAKKDTLGEKVADVAQLFNVAKNRLSNVALGPEEIIEGYARVETKPVFSDTDFRKMTEDAASGNGSFFSNMSKLMIDISMKRTGRRWGVFLTENGMGIGYDGHIVRMDLCQGSRLLNMVNSLNGANTPIHYSELRGHGYSWISASCNMRDTADVPNPHVALAFTNFYPGIPKQDLRIFVGSMKLPRTWRITESRNFLGISCCDAFSPCAYFVAEENGRERYEIVMMGNCLVSGKDHGQSALVFVRDNETGVIFEAK